MDNSITHYQTSFRVNDPDKTALHRLKNSVYGWILTKEKDSDFINFKADFLSKCDWRNLSATHSSVYTASYFSDSGKAWAFRYKHLDGEVGPKRFWFSDIGFKEDAGTVIVSVRISYAWNDEDLSHKHPNPSPSVPRLIRFIINEYHVFCGRPEFKLIEKPIHFAAAGMGKALCDFIQSPDRKYPLIVFNGDDDIRSQEAGRLAKELTGKCLVAIVSENVDLAQEIRLYLPSEYRIPFNFYRVYFPFNQRRNSSGRHRWYCMESSDYAEQREGVVHGLLRNHILLERGAVETTDDIHQLIARDKLLKLEAASPLQQRQLNEFLDEHAKVATERDNFKQEAAVYAAEIDRLEDEVGKLEWRCRDYQNRFDAVTQEAKSLNTSELMPTLPQSLLEVAKRAGGFFPRLIITKRAIESAEDYFACKSISETWEMLYHLNCTMWPLKFNDSAPKDLEKLFKEKSGYELALGEGKMTQKDRKLMKMRILVHDEKEYDISWHLKYQTIEPKCVRIYFAFDEDSKKIVVGHIGKHIPNATTKTL